MLKLGSKPSKWLGVIGHRHFPLADFRPLFNLVEQTFEDAAAAGFSRLLFGPAGGSGHLAGMTGLKKKQALYLLQPWADFGPDLADWERPTYSFLRSRATEVTALVEQRPSTAEERQRLVLLWARTIVDRLYEQPGAVLVALWDGNPSCETGVAVDYALSRELKVLWINPITGKDFWLC